MFLVSNLVLSTMCAPSHHKMCPTFAVHDNEGAHNHFPLLPASLIEPLYDRLIQVQRITAKDMTPFICHWRWPRSIWTQIRNRSGSMFFPLTRYCLMNKIALSVVFKSSRSACKKRSRRRCRKLFFLKRLAVITFVTALPLILLRAGYYTQHLRFWAGFRTTLELLGHKDLKTSMKYTLIPKRGTKSVRSLFDEVKKLLYPLG